MASSDIRSQNMGAGLRKALCDLCREMLLFYDRKIEEEPLTVAPHKATWRKGSFQWHYVLGVEYWTTVFFDQLEDIAMARGQKNAKQKRSLEAYSFVRCELSSEDKKAAKVWIDENMADMGPIIHDIVAEDYKLSVSFSSDHDTFTASLTGKEGAVNEFKTLTARHKDWHVAAMTVAFKHTVMFKSKVWESEDTEDDGWA